MELGGPQSNPRLTTDCCAVSVTCYLHRPTVLRVFHEEARPKRNDRHDIASLKLCPDPTEAASARLLTRAGAFSRCGKSRPTPTDVQVTHTYCGTCQQSPFFERVGSARVRIGPASVSRRHPRRRVDEQVAQLLSVTSTECSFQPADAVRVNQNDGAPGSWRNAFLHWPSCTRCGPPGAVVESQELQRCASPGAVAREHASIGRDSPNCDTGPSV